MKLIIEIVDRPYWT